MKARQAVICAALLGVFAIDYPQCGSYRAAHAQLAQVYLRDGLYGQALAEARRAIREDGPEARLLLVCALAHLGLDEIDAALERLGQAIALDPNNGDLHAVLRDICLRHERFAQAQALLGRLGADHPHNAWLAATQGWLLARQERLVEAEQALLRAIELDDHHLFAHIERSQILIDSGRFGEAESALAAALDLQPENPQLLLILGDCQLRFDHDAVADLAGATELRLLVLGDCQLHLDRDAEADTTLAKALATRAVAPVDIAQIYYQHQRPKRAIEYYQHALSRAPRDPLILNNLAWTYAEEGMRLHYALELSLQAVKIEADSPVYLDTYAELLHLLGRHQHAIAVIGQALAHEETDGEHRAYLEDQLAKFRGALYDRL